MKSRHRCPACNNPFKVQTEDGTTIVWCDVRRCPSEKSNDGIKGYDSESALAKRLIQQLLDDPDWPVDITP